MSQLGTDVAPARQGALSRVTLVGERRRIDLVLPAHEPVGVLLPEVMRLLGDTGAGRPMARHVTRGDGSALALESSLAEAGVPDGAVLRLVRVEDAPSAPVVHDVTDEASEDLDVRAWRWGQRAKGILCGSATAFGVGLLGVLARVTFDPTVVGVSLLGAACALLMMAAAVLRKAQEPLGLALLGTGFVAGVVGVWSLADGEVWSATVRWGLIASVAVLTLVVAGWCSTFGRGAIFGAAVTLVLASCWEGALAAWPGQGQGQSRAAAVLALVSLVVLGVLPRFAASGAGLAGLDDRRSGGVSVSRYEVSTALAATHRGLVLATSAVAVSASLAGVLTLRRATEWTVLIAVLVPVVLMLRARAFPLVAEVVSLHLAGAVVVVALLWRWLQDGSVYGPLAVLAVLTLLPLVAMLLSPAEHVRVRLRRVGDVAESVGVIALVPLVIGAFGVYGRLLDTFA